MSQGRSLPRVDAKLVADEEWSRLHVSSEPDVLSLPPGRGRFLARYVLAVCPF